MTPFSFGSYLTEVDEAATKEWYNSSDGWNCTCGHCRNFLQLAKTGQLPKPVTELLDLIGIPPEKATYVCEIYHNDEGLHYQFSYRLAGRIIRGDPKQSNPIRCCHEPYPYGAIGFPEPHFDLEFWLTLPWVLEEPL